MTLATVLIPTWNAPTTLGPALETALAQTVRDIEILVVCDGTEPATLMEAEQYARRDERVRLLRLPKASARGERNRHHGVLAAKSPIIVYLADDDLLLPRHVELVVDALQTHDLVQSWNTYIDANGELRVLAADLGNSEWHRWHLAVPPLNRISITGTAHTAAMYARLPDGWRIPDEGMPADLTLWRQFFSVPGLRAVTLREATAIQFPGFERRELDLSAIAAIRAPWEAFVKRPDAHEQYQELVRDATRSELVRAGLDFRTLITDRQHLLDECTRLQAELDARRRSKKPRR